MTKNGSFDQTLNFYKNQRGISIPEILIVFLVLAILVVIALPSGVRQMQLYRLETSVSVLGNKLMETRMNAIKRNRTSWLRIDKTARTMQIKSTDNTGGTINVNHIENLPVGVNLDSTNSVEIHFDSLGRFTSGSQNLSVIESNSNKRKSISVSPAGKISIGQIY